MKKVTSWNNAFSKVILSFILFISMFVPFLNVPHVQAAETISVAEAIANNTGKATVKGFIVGTANSGTSYDQEAPFTSATNLGLADSPDEKDASKIIPVQLPSGGIRVALNLVDNENLYKTEVTITGTLEAYFSVPGLKSPTAYSLMDSGGTAPVETKVSEVKASPASSAVEAGTEVTLSTSTTNTKIHYTVDGTEPTTAASVFAEPIIIDKDTTIKAIAVDNDSTRNLEDSDIATFTYTIKAPLTDSTIAEARAAAIGQEVMVTGTVTALLDTATAHIQDSEGDAIAIYPASSLAASVGDIVTVQGTVAEYSGLMQLTNITLVGSPVASTVPTPLVVTSAGMIDANESKLVTLKNVSITGAGRDYLGTDAEGTFNIYDKTEDSGLIAGKTYNEITGIVGQYGTKMQLLPISVIEDATKVQDIQVSKSGGVTVGTTVTLSTQTPGAAIHYTTDGTNPTPSSPIYNGSITITEPMTLKAIGVKDGLTSTSIATFTYTIIDGAGATISDIQGAGHASEYLGLNVTDVEGVVTFVTSTSNFIMQESNNTTYDKVKSNAIKVNKSSHGMAVGDSVKLSGMVAEVGGASRLTDTTINATTVMKTGIATVPTALVIGTDLMPPNKIIDNDSFAIFDPQEDGIDFWESIEYMNVSFPNTRIIGPIYNNDSPIVVPNTTNNTFNVNGGLNIAADDYNPEKIMLEGVSGKNYESGDQFDADLIGFVENFTDGYRVNTNKVFPAVTKANNVQEVTHIEPVADKLTVASYNVENFSNNLANTPDAKVEKIAKTFVTNMKSPDIITLVEVQDNDGETDSGDADASESYMRLINAIEAAEGPSYNWIDVTPINNTVGGAPGGNIRVGYLYNPTRVTLVNGTTGTGDQANSWTEEGNLSLNAGFIDPTKFNDTRKPLAAEFEFKDERVVIIGAHLNSKGGDGSLWGPTQPPVLGSVPERLGLAQAINDFIDEGLAKNPNLNIVVAGDMNDFEFTPALETLKGGVLTNMVDKVPVEDRFSYFFQGNNQVLDHILVSNNLVTATVADMIHINANFTEAQGRASDHDPVLVQIDLAAAEDVALKTYNIKNLKTKKLTLSKPSVSVTLDDQSVITDGIVFTGAKYAEFRGAGFANTTVTLKPSEANAIIDFKGTNVQKVIIDGTNVKEIRGAENIQAIEYLDGASEKTVSFTNTKGEPIVVPSLVDEDIELESYYQDASGKEGEALKAALHEIIDDHTELSYSQVWEALRETDEDPENSNNVILFYSGLSRSKTLNGGNNGDWNREHTWAKSHGDFGTSNGPGTDIHHLRPTDVQVNGSRGNLDFDNGGSRVINCAQCKGDSDSFEPPNYVKGDVARILFYMATRYEAGDRVDLELNEKVNNGKDPFHGKLSVLLEWHEQDPVDEFERNRNNVIQEWQGNRNPFIDHPEFAELIW